MRMPVVLFEPAESYAEPGVGAVEAASVVPVLHVIQDLDPRAGGPVSVVLALTAAQALLGHPVHLLAYASGDAAIFRQVTGQIPGFEKVRVHWLPALTRGERLLAPAAKAWLAEHLGHFAVVHTHGVWEAIVLAAATAARKAGVAYVVTPHGMLDGWALQRKAMKKRVALWMGRRAYVGEAGALHALSSHERDCVLAGKFHAQPVIIPNGVSLDQIDPLPAPGAFRLKHPELGDDPFIFFLARLHPGKGLDLLAEAFATLLRTMPTLRLVIAGPDEGAEAALRAQIDRLGIAERVHLIGGVWDTSKFAALVDCACFCLPSEHEGFSMSIAEAMACGAPVVITHLCHFPEVEEVGAGEVVEREVASLTRGLTRVLTNPDARAAYGARGRRLIEERFTWPRIAQRMIDVYRSLLIKPLGIMARGAA